MIFIFVVFSSGSDTSSLLFPFGLANVGL